MPKANYWIPVEENIPPEELVVETKEVSRRGHQKGHIKELVYKAGYWLEPDFLKRVDWAPTHWRLPLENS